MIMDSIFMISLISSHAKITLFFQWFKEVSFTYAEENDTFMIYFHGDFDYYIWEVCIFFFRWKILAGTVIVALIQVDAVDTYFA